MAAANALDAVPDLGRALGLVPEEAARDTTAIHTHQRARFLAARDQAAQAGSLAHAEPGS